MWLSWIEFHLDQGPWTTWTWRWMMCHGQCPWPSKNVQGMFSTWPYRRRREGWPPGKLLLSSLGWLFYIFDMLAIFGWVGVGFRILPGKPGDFHWFSAFSAAYGPVWYIHTHTELQYIQKSLLWIPRWHRMKKNVHISVCLSRFGSNLTAFSWLCVTLIRWLGGYAQYITASK